MALLPHEPPGEPLVATRLKESHREWGEGGVGQAGTGIELDVPSARGLRSVSTLGCREMETCLDRGWAGSPKVTLNK